MLRSLDDNRRFETKPVKGFTLVELLIVISIIGVLVALLMPAVQSAQESGRRAICSNNLHQMAMACLTHESAQTFLPTGGWQYGWAGDPNRGFNKRQPGGWHYNILPYMDQADLHDLGKGVDEATRKIQCGIIAKTPIATFICPSRRKVQAYPHSNKEPYWFPASIIEPDPVSARSDYAANGGDIAEQLLGKPQGPSTLAAGDAMPDTGPNSWSTTIGNTVFNGITGVVYTRSECSFASIKDGASFTYLAGERYINPDHYLTGNQSVSGNYECADNEGWDEGYDYDTNRWTGNGAGSPLPPRQDTPGYSDNGTCDRIFGSAHAAGFHMAFCDGTVRKMGYNIDPAIHQQLGNRMDGEPTQLQALDSR